jgi:16S rRNA processing protein RimM
MARTRGGKTLVECGRVVRPWGIKGELLIHWLSGCCPVEVGQGFVYREGDGGEMLKLKVVASRLHGKQHVVRFDGVESRNEADELRGATFFLPESELPSLPEGEYYSYQILGMDVVTDTGKDLGKVTQIFTAGDNDVYVVKRGSGNDIREVLIPALDSVVLKVDIEERKMTVKEVEGLLD